MPNSPRLVSRKIDWLKGAKPELGARTAAQAANFLSALTPVLILGLLALRYPKQSRLLPPLWQLLPLD